MPTSNAATSKQRVGQRGNLGDLCGKKRGGMGEMYGTTLWQWRMPLPVDQWIHHPPPKLRLRIHPIAPELFPRTFAHLALERGQPA